MGLEGGLVDLLLLLSTNLRISLVGTLVMTSMAGLSLMNGSNQFVVVTWLVHLMFGRTVVLFGMRCLGSPLAVQGSLPLPLALAGSADHGGTWSCFSPILILALRGLGCIFQFLDLCRRCRGLNSGGSLLPCRRPSLFIWGWIMLTLLGM